jgi:NYN domain
MKRDTTGPILSAVFVDYDNIYLSLKRKSEEAAKRFAKDAPMWIRAIENGQLITPTNGVLGDAKRRIVMNRCYGNPVPRRNTNDNSTDMNSFPFVRHHFLRAGFEVVDCPPLTAQLKNSADIRMVMDMRDYLTHDTYFDEFVILSGDADFTPVLHRLRQHARRTVIFANDYTAAPYTAICDGEVRESDFITLLLEGQTPAITDQHVHAAALAHAPQAQATAMPLHVTTAQQPAPQVQAPRLDDVRLEIIAEVVNGVRAAAAPVPLEALADRAIRAVGHDRTVGTSWAGTGGFRELLRQHLPNDIRMTDQPPYFAYDPKRHSGQERAQTIAAPQQHAPPPVERSAERNVERHVERPIERQIAAPQTFTPQRMPQVQLPAYATPEPAQVRHFDEPRQPAQQPPTQQSVAQRPNQPNYDVQAAAPQALVARAPSSEPMFHRAAPTAAHAPQVQAPRAEAANLVQQAMSRIFSASQVPQLGAPEYRVLFESMAQEINENDLNGAQTLTGIMMRAKERGLNIERDEVRFVLEVVSEADPWFEQGASVNIFAGRFRNYVVTRCRAQTVNLSADELDLVDGWFASGNVPQMTARARPAQAALAAPRQADPAPQSAAAADQRGAGSRWWSLEEGRQHVADQRPPARTEASGADDNDDFPRIVRTRLRG